MNSYAWFQLFGAIVLGAPTALLVVLGGAGLLSLRLAERTINRLTQGAVSAGLAASIGVLVLMLIHNERLVVLTMGDWVVLEEQHYHFTFKFTFDRLSVPFVILSFTLVGVIGAFASKYLHRESGYRRFFVLYAVFLLGMILTSLAGTIETLFAGWELVGLSSALLVAFFHERSAPVRRVSRGNRHHAPSHRRRRLHPHDGRGTLAGGKCLG
jgi:NAD(P)H-quinone oxidoreductase subunit 5